MREEVREAADRFIGELKALHSGIRVELLDGKTPWVDALVRVKCVSHEQVDDVAETMSHLTVKYYLEENIYITGSEYFSGPLLTEAR
mgnify:FL=1